MAAKKSIFTKPESELREIGMSFPETTEDFPWGHRALKVKGKAFVFMSLEEDVLSLSVKLPDSADFALMQSFAAPTGYGLGKSGWVTASFSGKDKVPVDLLASWLRESYVAVAPKKIGDAFRQSLKAAKAGPVAARATKPKARKPMAKKPKAKAAKAKTGKSGS
ncbi:MAG: hypothetical protein JWP91_564 [Fibrobacteres bacterium]|nr:hypothetical protein [Fibrobacterota bacterium]